MCKCLFAFFGMVLAMGVGRADANTLVNTIGNDTFVGLPAFSLGQNADGSGQSLALRFSTRGDSVVTGVQAYIMSGSASGVPQIIQLGLMADVGGLPSGAFVNGDVLSVTLSLTSPVDLTSLNWSITRGSDFWLVAVANVGSSGGWQSSSSASHVWAFGNGTGSIWQSPAIGAGDPLEAIVTGGHEATPLPPALPLFATGLGAIGLLGWRRKRKAQAVAA